MTFRTNIQCEDRDIGAISANELKPSPPRTALPQLDERERYIGALSDRLGSLQHVILLPGDNDVADWETQMAWAKSIGGDLPSKTELAMLWGSGREQFQLCLYWSNQTYEKHSGYAWFQGFTHGDLLPGHKGAEFRARAVRRVPVQCVGEQRAPAAGDAQDAARWRSLRSAITRRDEEWLNCMDRALTAMGIAPDADELPSDEQVDAAADAAIAAQQGEGGAA